jgi:uncharacterized cupredoxin-like copper-binding protein
VSASPRPVVAALAAAALLVAGCGAKKDVTTGSAGAAAAPKTVSVQETEYKITPADPRISGAGTVNFRIRNSGKTTHQLEVQGPGGEQKSLPVPPGATTTFTAKLQAGNYDWYCPIDSHKKKGMRGKFTVGKASAGSGSGTTTTPPKQDNKGGGSRYY